MELYNWIRTWSAPEHQTMWVEIQALATIAAFVAAAIYAWIARRQAEAIEAQVESAKRQLGATERQLHVAEGQLTNAVEQQRLSQLSRWQDNKPIVVLDRRDYPDRGKGDFGFVLCNIGRGFAVNVFQFDSRAGEWHSLGG